MVEQTCPVLKSCKHQVQCYQASDGVNELPDDVVMLIMSLLTMKEAARSSVVSQKWNHLWRCFPVLIFNNYAAMRRMNRRDIETFLQERERFFKWVNGVLDAHLGETVDELRVAFDFDSTCQSHMDKWVEFAIAKQVKRLELDFTTPFFTPYSSPSRWKMSLFRNSLSCLCCLCLRFVDISTEDVDCLIRSCKGLENLSIDHSPSLTYVRACDPPLQLKHLEVSHCPQLKTIDIVAPKLLSFIHTGNPAIELHIRNASLLSEVSVGDREFRGDVVAYAFDSLYKYFSQLHYLRWQMNSRDVILMQFNLGINNPPAMTNLKHLKLDVKAKCEQSLLGWTKLIEASPLLQRLSVKISLAGPWSCRKIVKHNGVPLRSLKTLDLCGDLGYPIDLEFATYVIENSIMLKDVVVDFRPIFMYLISSRSTNHMQVLVAKLARIVPQGCKLHARYGGSSRRYREILFSGLK